MIPEILKKRRNFGPSRGSRWGDKHVGKLSLALNEPETLHPAGTMLPSVRDRLPLPAATQEWRRVEVERKCC